MSLEVGTLVWVATGSRLGCLAVVARPHERGYCWLTPLHDKQPLGYYHERELEVAAEGDVAMLALADGQPYRPSLGHPEGTPDTADSGQPAGDPS